MIRAAILLVLVAVAVILLRHREPVAVAPLRTRESAGGHRHVWKCEGCDARTDEAYMEKLFASWEKLRPDRDLQPSDPLRTPERDADIREQLDALGIGFG
jgi:hypothetical protein